MEGGGGCTQQPVLLPFCMNVRAQQLLRPESPTHTLLSPSAGSDQLVLIHFLSPSAGSHPPPVLQLRYVSSVFAGGQRCAALSDQNVMGFIASLHELAASERRFYWKLCSIKAQILVPLLELGEAVGRWGPREHPEPEPEPPLCLLYRGSGPGPGEGHPGAAADAGGTLQPLVPPDGAARQQPER